MKNDNLKKTAYKFIKKKIINGEYKPNFIIAEKQIALELEISRTPIREALLILEGEDYVKIFPRKGTIIKEITLKSIKDVFQVRKLLEPHVFELTQNKISDVKIMEFEEKFIDLKKNLSLLKKTEKSRIFDTSDYDFHDYFLELCGNEILIQVMRNIYEKTHRIQNLLVKSDIRIIESLDEHLELIYALRSGSISSIHKASVSHIQKVQLDFFENFDCLDF